MQPIKVKPKKIQALKHEFDRREFVIPKFQRKFVWNRKNVCSLIDSVCKNYPIGSILYWETDNKNIFKPLGNLPDFDDDNKYIRYILDGQQRLTSFYGVIFGIKLFNKDKTLIDCRKISLNLNEAKKGFKDDIQLIEYHNPDYKNYFPIQELIDPQAFLDIEDNLEREDKRILREVNSNIMNYEIPFIEMTSSDTEGICESFVRINDRGAKLNTVNLVMATAWSENFDLQSEVDIFQEELEKKNWMIKEENIIQAVSLILKGSIAKSTQIKLKVGDIEREWNKIKKSINLALDYFRGSLGVMNSEFLPFGVMLPILSYFYFKNGHKSPDRDQDKIIKNWFWQSSFAEQFSGSGFTTYVVDDKKRMDQIINGEKVEINYKEKISENKLRNKLIKTTLNRISSIKSAFLCLLALEKPRHFENGNPIILDNSIIDGLNDKNKHHIFPYAHLKRHKRIDKEINSILNICFIPFELNNQIRDKKPSVYFKKYKNNKDFQKILKSHLISEDGLNSIWNDNYDEFLQKRSVFVIEKVKSLIGDLSKLEEDLKDDPNSVIDKLESEIRIFIDDELASELGDDYWKKVIPSDIQYNVKQRIKKELDKNPSMKSIKRSRDKLSFCNSTDYFNIIMKNWDIFEQYFKNKNSAQTHFNFFNDYRNSVKHTRNIDKVAQKMGEGAIEWIFNIVSPEYQGE